jgi:hypothetical protein
MLMAMSLSASMPVKAAPVVSLGALLALRIA